MYENFNLSEFDGAESVHLPDMSVIVPVVVPKTNTLTL